MGLGRVAIASISIAITILLALTKSCHSAKILLVVQHYHSHAQVVAAVGDELHARGHAVTMVAAQAVQSLSSKEFKVRYYQTPVRDQDLADCTAQSLKNQDPLLSACNRLFRDDILAFTNGKELLDELKRENFDGLICDVASYACLIVAEYINIKVQVDVSPIGLLDPLTTSPYHIPGPPAYVPQMAVIATNKMNLYQRTQNVIFYGIMITLLRTFMFSNMYRSANITNLGFNSPPSFELRRSTFLIANGDFAVDYPRPITPATKVVGPLLPKPAQTLPDDLQQFASANKNGTIVVSFGSVMIGLKYVTDLEIFFQAFGQLPYNVIWKFSDKITHHIPDNLKVVQWLPQNDLLGHHNVKALVTHCGLNSVLEAAYHGVPMIGIPIAADGMNHAQKIIARNIGVILDIKTMTSNDLSNAIINVVTDKFIAENATKISAFIKNRPNGRTPAQEAGDWVEFALGSEGGNYLRTEEYNLRWYELYLIDVYAVLIIICYLFIKLMKLVWKGIANVCCRRKEKVKKS
ncbi:uncharacterized protein TRIADDRAFT_57718 [Trichoplax adhaerens]|uniref:Glucuronosyltransferase n=1 Tax=Trichoplax adhaerens TaxID=10228 RepID=B3S081_TRIAD|nr:hypothetical protein TRIADDRAFT_57718 [Trichoplax adhaerens]EDV23961.1 hypothetical protein TRIADDRAFT_57718 [Trichoplax adhaerens]|eukprot:XP_002113487.1 hypothetical protein TRIADDRAFT_57718 [Trichoplax adhaerens]